MLGARGAMPGARGSVLTGCLLFALPLVLHRQLTVPRAFVDVLDHPFCSAPPNWVCATAELAPVIRSPGQRERLTLVRRKQS